MCKYCNPVDEKEIIEFREYLSCRKLEEVISTLFKAAKHCNNSISITIINFSASLFFLKDSVLKDEITKKDYNKEIDLLTTRVSSFLNTLKIKKTDPLIVPKKRYEQKDDLEFSVYKVCISEILIEKYESDESLTITEIYKLSGKDKRKHINAFIAEELRMRGWIIEEKRKGLLYWKLNEKGYNSLKRLLP